MSSQWLDQVETNIVESASRTADLGNSGQTRNDHHIGTSSPSAGTSCFELLEDVKPRTVRHDPSNVVSFGSVHSSDSCSDSDLSADEQQCELYPRCILPSRRNYLSEQRVPPVLMEGTNGIESMPTFPSLSSGSSHSHVESENSASTFPGKVVNVANRPRYVTFTIYSVLTLSWQFLNYKFQC